MNNFAEVKNIIFANSISVINAKSGNNDIDEEEKEWVDLEDALPEDEEAGESDSSKEESFKEAIKEETEDADFNEEV